MNKYTKVLNGVVVTDTDVPPPNNWTNVYEDIGGDKMWGKDKEIEQVVRDRGIAGDIKPLYGSLPYAGEDIYLFEVGTRCFFLYNIVEMTLFMINGNLDLQDIVSIIGNEDKGLKALALESTLVRR